MSDLEDLADVLDLDGDLQMRNAAQSNSRAPSQSRRHRRHHDEQPLSGDDRGGITERERGRQRDRDRERGSDRDRGRDTGSDRERDRESDRQRDRGRDGNRDRDIQKEMEEEVLKETETDIEEIGTEIGEDIQGHKKAGVAVEAEKEEEVVAEKIEDVKLEEGGETERHYVMMMQAILVSKSMKVDIAVHFIDDHQGIDMVMKMISHKLVL